MKVKDIGNECVHCRKDTSFGSGLFVDRYPAEILDEENDIILDGYCCNVCEQKYIDSLDEDERARYTGVEDTREKVE